MLTCDQCNTAYQPKHYGTSKHHHFCSVACRLEHQKARGKRTCQWCNQPFTRRTGHAEQVYCSHACGRRAYVSAHRKPQQLTLPIRKAPHFDCICRVCSKQFTAKHPTNTFCSEACKRVYRHAINFIRRSTYGADMAEPIDFAIVCERDRWTCGLCGEPVNRELKWPNHGAPSLDHITPISVGGLHRYDNVQLAHLGCNWKKGKPRANKAKA